MLRRSGGERSRTAAFLHSRGKSKTIPYILTNMFEKENYILHLTATCLEIWTVEEDITLRNLVESLGTGNCMLMFNFYSIKLPEMLLDIGTDVSESLPGRTGKQCRERWHNHLGQGIKKGDWTDEVSVVFFI